MATLLQGKHIHHTLLSAARFTLVGALGTFVDFTLFFAMQMLFNLPMLVANTISYGAGMINNFYFHRTWTFAHRAKKTASQQFALFIAVSLVALAVNNLVAFLLNPFFAAHLANASLAAILAKICATAAGIGWNFFANHLWTFGR